MLKYLRDILNTIYSIMYHVYKERTLLVHDFILS